MMKKLTSPGRTVKRVPIGLTDHDLADLARIRQAPNGVPGLGENPSEAAAAAAVFHLGLRALREQQEAEGYAALAASQDDEDRAVRAAARARRARVVERA
jgi:hypothetical protein